MSSEKVELKLDWCSHEAAKFACEHWHYSRCMPAGKLVKIGVWENDVFKGVVLYGRGANNNIGSPYGLDQTEVCELVRIALNKHKTHVSKIMAISIKMIVKQSKGLKLIISMADPEQNHTGSIYQATNWIYTGRTQEQCEVMYNGKIMHKRTANSKFGTIKGMEKSKPLWKHKYLMPLDEEMRKQVLLLSKPYPKKSSAGSSKIEQVPIQEQEGGVVPTSALHFSSKEETDAN